MKIIKEGTITIDKDGNTVVSGFVIEGTVMDLYHEATRRLTKAQRKALIHGAKLTAKVGKK